MQTIESTGQALAVVPNTLANQIRRLQAEARTLARDHVAGLTNQLAEAGRVALEIAEGGDAYPAGVRDVARRLAEELEGRGQTLDSIMSKASS